MSLSFLAIGYEHINRGGSQRLFGVGNSDRYNPIEEWVLAETSFDRVLSSIEVDSSNSATANVLLFSNNLHSSSPDNFAGSFRQIVAEKAGTPSFANLTDFGFNDQTRSIMLINTARVPGEIRRSFRDMFLDTWKQMLDAELGSDASRKGDPLMTWSAFPEGVSYLSSDQIYLEISQALNINLPRWPDYDATMTYHLYLYLDAAHRLNGYCKRWAQSVESGLKHDEIDKRLWKKVTAGVDTINDTLTQNFASLQTTFRDFYYLPGRQTAPISGVSSANTSDDVTLVFEL